MFDLLSAIRDNHLKLASVERLRLAALGGASDSELEQLKDDYIADLIAECEAVGLRAVEHKVIPLRRSNVVPLRGGDDGPRAA